MLALITPLYERENYFAKYNPIVIKQLVLIYVVYDGTNYNIYIYIDDTQRDDPLPKIHVKHPR